MRSSSRQRKSSARYDNVQVVVEADRDGTQRVRAIQRLAGSTEGTARETAISTWARSSTSARSRRRGSEPLLCRAEDHIHHGARSVMVDL